VKDAPAIPPDGLHHAPAGGGIRQPMSERVLIRPENVQFAEGSTPRRSRSPFTRGTLLNARGGAITSPAVRDAGGRIVCYMGDVLSVGVVGGGIGGLAAALLLHRAGFDVHPGEPERDPRLARARACRRSGGDGCAASRTPSAPLG
jgi:hypothetical protein